MNLLTFSTLLNIIIDQGGQDRVVIVRTSEGRAKSERTEAEQIEVFRNSYKNLTEEEKATFDALMKSVKSGNDRMLDMMNESKYKWHPVPMQQFLEDDYYLGRACETLYPRLKEDLIELFSSNYREVVFSGSIGWGKTFVTSVAICRILYELSCLISPQEAFGLSAGSEMVITLASKNLHLATHVLKSAVDDKLKISPYFKNSFTPRYGRGAVVSMNTIFPENIRLSVSSYGSDRILGTNVFAAVLDEANFARTKKEQITTAYGMRKKVSNYDSAEKLYGSLVTRIKSRFLQAGGDLPGMVILLSSAEMIGSFIDRRIDEAEDDSGVFVREYANWDVKPPGTYCGKTFKILVGSSSLRAKILDEDEDIPMSFIHDNEGRVVDVPIEFKPDFERNLEDAIRDIAGISTHAISAFIQRVEAIQDCIVEKPHPFTVEEWQYGTPGSYIWDRLVVRKERRLPGGHIEDVWIPLENPGAARHIHIDTSLSGCSTGFSMGYIDRWVDVVRRAENGDTYTDQAPYIKMDIMLRVLPPYGEQIQVRDVNRLVYELLEHGFCITGVSTDMFQNAAVLQPMKQHGLNAYLISTDKSTEPYDDLKSAIYEKRMEFYKYQPFIDELKALEIDREKNKVEKPLAGSKDVSDSVCCVVHGLIKDSKRLPIDATSDNVDNGKGDYRWVTGGMISEKIGSNKDYDDQDDDFVIPFLMGD